MNKKRFIVPSIVLSVSVVLLVITLVLTTSFIFCTGLNTFNGERIEKSMLFSEFAYKINPCYSNLRALYDSYNCFRYYDPYGEDGTVVISQAPEGYYKKCAEYSMKMYEYYLANPKAYRSNQNSNPSFDVAYLSQEHALADALSQRVISLYLDGQKEEAQKTLNEHLSEPFKEKTEVYLTFLGFVVAVHDLEDDVNYQKWMVEVEEKITKAYYEAFPEKDEVDNMFTRGAYYKPFDWQK